MTVAEHFDVIEKSVAVCLLFGVDAVVAKRLCERFGIDPYELVAQ